MIGEQIKMADGSTWRIELDTDKSQVSLYDATGFRRFRGPNDTLAIARHLAIALANQPSEANA